MKHIILLSQRISLLVPSPTEPKKALKPTIFQEYELKEKTILSHNTAM